LRAAIRPTKGRTTNLSYPSSLRFHSARRPKTEMWKSANCLYLYTAFSDFGKKKIDFVNFQCVVEYGLIDETSMRPRWDLDLTDDWGVKYYIKVVDQVNVSQQIIHQNGCCIAHSKNIAQAKILMRGGCRDKALALDGHSIFSFDVYWISARNSQA
jgi:hypothetical protein